MPANQKERDDLTQISGIGGARDQWLADVFDVRTYHDLAALSPDEIEAQFKAENKPYKRSEIELWVQEAKKLSLEHADETNDSSVNSSSANEHSGTTSSMGPKSQEKPWTTMAMFSVEFQKRFKEDQHLEQQTKVKDQKTEKENFWPGIEVSKIGPWMIEQAGDRLPPDTKKTPIMQSQSEPVRDTKTTNRMTISIVDLRIYQPETQQVTMPLGTDRKLYAGVIRSDQVFDLETDFVINDQSADMLQDQNIPYLVQFYAQNRDTKKQFHLGNAESGILSSDKNDYSSSLAGVRLPHGDYYLNVTVSAKFNNIVPGYLQLPMLKVA